MISVTCSLISDMQSIFFFGSSAKHFIKRGYNNYTLSISNIKTGLVSIPCSLLVYVLPFPKEKVKVSKQILEIIFCSKP